MARILIVDDELAMVEVISTLCRDLGGTVFPFQSGERALEELESVAPQVVITDLEMGKVGGFEVLQACRRLPHVPAVILVTGHASVETAVEAMRQGAFDYITKPFQINDLQKSIQRAVEQQSAVREPATPLQDPKERYKFENIIGNSPKMQALFTLISKIADTESTVLIHGESGTGKELVARALHFNSRRQAHPFVAINCSALPENLLESELFGHKKGAFTGAVQDKPGLFEEAEQGTIFLDEINSMAPLLQTKLLRVLQERQIRRVGETQSIPVDVRVLAATNESLPDKIRTGEFREDLYYRLAVIPVEIPALRERTEDIPLLVEHFVQKISMQNGVLVPKVNTDVLQVLYKYPWPGNVRELENVMARASALCDGGVIRKADLPEQVLEPQKAHTGEPDRLSCIGQTLESFSREQERWFITETLKFNNGDRKRTAQMLGVSLATLYRKLV